MNDLIVASFEAVGETGQDITPDVYERYYALAPEAGETMSHVDIYMQGRMLAEVIELIMTPPDQLSEKYLVFETANHTQSYGVDLQLYRPLFESLRDVVRSALGTGWSSGHDDAWSERIDALESAVLAAAAKAG